MHPRWSVGSRWVSVGTARGQPQPRPTGTLPMPHGCPRAVHAVAVHGEIHGLSTRSPATKPTRRLRHGYGCAKNIQILHAYSLCSDKVKTVLFGLLGALQPLRDSDIAILPLLLDRSVTPARERPRRHPRRTG